MKQLLFILLPLFLLMHLIAVVITVGTAPDGLRENRSVAAYFRRSAPCFSYDIRITVIRKLKNPMLLLFACGIAICVINLLAPTVYEHGCLDPILSTTIAVVKANDTYQWLYIVFIAAMMFVKGMLVDVLRTTCSGRERHSKSVHKALLNFVLTASSQTRILRMWQKHYYETTRTLPQKSKRRRAIYVLLHIPGI